MTNFSRTDSFEAKDRNARGKGQGPRTQFFYIMVGKFSIIFCEKVFKILHFVKFLMIIQK